MKPIIFFIFLAISFFCKAQKIGYIDSDFLIEQIPQYKESQSKLDSEIKKWQQEIAKEQKSLDSLKISFSDEKILLTDIQIKHKEKQIKKTEDSIKQIIEKRFGEQGDILKYRQNIAKPVQDMLFNAIKTVSEKYKYNWIVNKGASGVDFLFTDGKNDVTTLVLKELGVGANESETKKLEKKLKKLISKDKNIENIKKISTKIKKDKENKEDKEEVDERQNTLEQHENNDVKQDEKLDEKSNEIKIEQKNTIKPEEAQKIEPKKETEKLSPLERIKRKAEQLRLEQNNKENNK